MPPVLISFCSHTNFRPAAAFCSRATHFCQLNSSVPLELLHEERKLNFILVVVYDAVFCFTFLRVCVIVFFSLLTQ
jgi:hypothetical protein